MKLTIKNKIGNAFLDLLNNSCTIVEILQKYRNTFLSLNTIYNNEVYYSDFYKNEFLPLFSKMCSDLLKTSPYTIIIIRNIKSNLNELQLLSVHLLTSSYIDYFNSFLLTEINNLKYIIDNIKKIYSRTSSTKKGYVQYNNLMINMPNCNVYFKKSRKNTKPYIYNFHIDSSIDLFNATVYSLSLTNYKIYRCDICDKYFTSRTTRKTCSVVCENKANELRLEKIRNRNLINNSDDVTKLYRRIKNFYNRTVNNKNKQSLKDKMRRDFDDRYDKKITALNKQYKSPLDDRFQKQLLIWLEKEYIRIQETFPSKKFGNTNRSSS